MSSLIFVSPMALSAMVSLWLGWQVRLILFGAWVSACVAIAILLMRSAFGDGALSRQGLVLLAALVMFQVAAFGLGLLVARARRARPTE